ncbi:protein-L-isoaspartate O-methyltransferase family protein [Alkalisalibacterium limincola]|uniref:Protein-L-isoaspartate O-methyltransferase n=1 Tax=Alkalisalibacterium limincola TaxID=2699169 RepID=A0A5C8KLE7_9GAMM|nr:protein-L-isoaspartate O-methyltransferase [Alkalisalibacterium limincola]TXK61079.1 protein-L-isoaspartate O-methyltransferase [Alkalisalibacterium limincola]
MPPIDFEAARFLMIEQQVRPWEVLDPAVLDTIGRLQREDFVPLKQRKLAYVDVALPLDHGQQMMKPVVEGRMLQSLELADSDEVLEIGTGSGYITACLADLARAVVSIDIQGEFTERCRARLAELGMNNVRLETADAFAFEPGKQFDAVCVTGAVADVPERFLSWVKPGGRLFIIRGPAPVQEAVRLLRTDSGWEEQSLFETELTHLAGAEPVQRFAL